MKTTNTIIFSLCVGFFIIGIYESITYGISYAYWWFMLSMGLLFYYTYRRRSQDENKREFKSKKRR